MPKQKLDKETRDAIKEARKLIEEVAKVDGNEAETRRRVERIFATLMGYDVFKHVTREHAVAFAGSTDYCDFAIQVDEEGSDSPVIMVEIKAVNVELMPKHLKQVSSYAINKGTEWVILTNGKEWRLYHVSFGQPPQSKLIDSWDVLIDDPATLAAKFSLVGYKSVKKGILDEIWRKANVLTPQNLVTILVSEASIKLIQRELKKATDVLVSPEEIVGAIRRILNETSLEEMGAVRISLPGRKGRRKAIDEKLLKKGDLLGKSKEPDSCTTSMTPDSSDSN
jgi:predicted type IV restriction endonuclease